MSERLSCEMAQPSTSMTVMVGSVKLWIRMKLPSAVATTPRSPKSATADCGSARRGGSAGGPAVARSTRETESSPTTTAEVAAPSTTRKNTLLTR